MATNGKRIVLGSGKLYAVEFTGTIPEDATIETEDNLLGLIQGGATLEYKPEFYEAVDDLELVSKTILTKEETTLKSGIMTWCGNTLKRLCSTARVKDTSGKRTVKIGGVANQDGKSYLIRFVHEDAEDGNIRITIVGKNEAGFSFTFAKDKETVIDAEFKAKPLDSEGTKIIYTEDTEPVGSLTVTSVAGTTTGTTAITVTPVLTNGNSYAYKVDTTLDLPALDSICNTTTGFTAWNGTADITAATNKKIVIVEIDANSKAVNAGIATVTAKV
jgi:hypothetical protein